MSHRVLAILLHQPNAKIADLAEIFFRYSSQVAIRGTEAILLETSKSMRLYSMDTLIHRVRVHLQELNISASLASAEDVPTALAYARYGKTRKGELPVAALFDYVSPFEILEPTKINFYRKRFSLLERLGVRHINRFLALPEKTIVNHMGGDMLSLYDAVKDSRDIPWPFFKPKEKVVEGLRPDEQRFVSNTLESMSFLFKSLVDRTVLRLRGRGERLLSFRLVLELEKHSLSEGQRVYDFDLSLPHTSARDLLFMIREKLDFDFQRRPLSAVVEDLRLEVIEVAPHSFAQKDLMNPKKEEENEAFRSLLSRLAEKIGSEKVFMAEPQEAYRPEISWKKTLNDLHQDTKREDKPMNKNLENKKSDERTEKEFPQRPLRLFKTPLRVNPSWLSHVQVLDSPEVLSGEWWDRGFERIYFRVQVPHGEKFWVFKTQKELFIHGVF